MKSYNNPADANVYDAGQSDFRTTRQRVIGALTGELERQQIHDVDIESLSKAVLDALK